MMAFEKTGITSGTAEIQAIELWNNIRNTHKIVYVTLLMEPVQEDSAKKEERGEIYKTEKNVMNIVIKFNKVPK